MLIMIKKKFLTIFIFTIIITLIINEACSYTSSKASDYYKNIYDCTVGIFKSEDTLIGAITDIRNIQSRQYIADKYIPDTNIDMNIYINNIDKLYESFLFSIDSSKIALKKLNEFNGDKLLKNGALELNICYKSIAEKYYKRIIHIIKTPPENYTVEDDTRFQDISDTINIYLENGIEKFNKISEEFISYYDVDL